jgi:hypothetical protein
MAMSTLDDLYQKIFYKPPLESTEADLQAIVQDFRSKRHLFNLGDKKAGSTKKVKEGALSLKLDLKL